MQHFPSQYPPPYNINLWILLFLIACWSFTTILLHGNRLAKGEINRLSSHLNPDSQRIFAQLFSGEALSICHTGRDGERDGYWAGIARCGDGDCCNGASWRVDIPTHFWLTCISGHSVSEGGVDLEFVSFTVQLGTWGGLHRHAWVISKANWHY